MRYEQNSNPSPDSSAFADPGLSRLANAAISIRYWLLPIFLFALSDLAFATAGGAGGGGGGGDGGGGDGAEILLEILLWIILELPFPYNFITLGIIFFCVWFATRRVRAVSGLNRIPSTQQMPAKPREIPGAFMARNPGFSPESLLAKANTAFVAIQDAWSKQDMSAVRRYISDGVWQRFNTQFSMMRLLEQQNTVDSIQIRRIFIDGMEEDGKYDIAHLGIHFIANDDFVSAKHPQLDRSGSLETLEYWTFIRKSGVEEKDMYHSNACPACGAELPNDMGEVARCASCHAVSTLGDYDWVLCEITQADDYANENARLKKSGSLTGKIRSALGTDGDFSLQSIEDKASNAYMQIQAAQVSRRPEMMRRFVGDALFDRLAKDYAQQPAFVFNRLYLNNVTAIDFYRADGRDNLVVAVKRTAQRVGLAGDELTLIDQGMHTRNEILILSRDVGAGDAKSSLYAHACPACGGPVGDTLDLKCTYCGEVLNSTGREWIVTGLLAADEYKALADRTSGMTTGVAATQLDPLYSVRDYAFNNVLMIVGIDGAITADELAFSRELSRRLGYDEQKLAGMFELAKNRKLSLRLPENRKSANKVRALMEKAALADRQVSAAEKALLDEVSARVEGISL